MREATGTLNTFRIVIVFTLLFAVFITLAISYNKVIKLKNESLSIIEINEGVTRDSLNIINRFLRNNGYSARSRCNDGEYGMPSLNDDATLEHIVGSDNSRYFYCLEKGETLDSISTKKIFYNLKLFYNFEIPLFGGVNLMVFNINGETRRLTYHEDMETKNIYYPMISSR